MFKCPKCNRYPVDNKKGKCLYRDCDWQGSIAEAMKNQKPTIFKKKYLTPSSLERIEYLKKKNPIKNK